MKKQIIAELPAIEDFSAPTDDAAASMAKLDQLLDTFLSALAHDDATGDDVALETAVGAAMETLGDYLEGLSDAPFIEAWYSANGFTHGTTFPDAIL